MRSIIAMAALVALSGCSSIVEGTNQTLTVNTTPPGATCDFNRENRVIGTIQSTPGSLLVEKTKHDINVVCHKDGYEDATFFNKSDVAGATVGNIILGGGIGWAIDSASGADNKYTEVMNITLLPKPVEEEKPTPRRHRGS